MFALLLAQPRCVFPVAVVCLVPVCVIIKGGRTIQKRSAVGFWGGDIFRVSSSPSCTKKILLFTVFNVPG